MAEPVRYERPSLGLVQKVRRSVGAFFTDGFFEGGSNLGKLLPISNPRYHDVEVETNLVYGDPSVAEHRLDVHRPKKHRGPLPTVLYLHGGGFRVLSKETHWLFALLFSRRGYLVLNIDYRLAPKHPYPAAIEDTCMAYCWAVKEAARLGGDPSRLIVAGESAGANLATALVLAATYKRPEPFARAVFDTGVVPAAALPAYGFLQISDPERYSRRYRLSGFTQDRLAEVADAYLHGAQIDPDRGLDLADPLVAFERGEPPDRPLPPFCVHCGTRDILIDDSRRLEAALGKLGAKCETGWFDSEIHGFNAFVMRPNARRSWRETFDFLDRHLPAKK